MVFPRDDGEKEKPHDVPTRTDDAAASSPERASPASKGGGRAKAEAEDGPGYDTDDTDEPEPEELLCPILRTMYRDPVFVAGSGNTYEREAIVSFWRHSRRPGALHHRDPLTNATIDNHALFTNWDKRREVQAWLARHPRRCPEGWPSRDVPPPVTSGSNPGGGDPFLGWLGLGAGGAGGRDGIPRGRFAVERASVGLAVAAAVAVVFFAATSPAPARSGWRAGATTSGATTRDVMTRGNMGHVVVPSGARRWAAGANGPPALSGFGDAWRETLVRVAPPAGSRISARRGRKGALEIVIPPLGVLNPQAFTESMFAAMWTSFTAAWTYGAVRSPSPAFALFSLPFWGVGAHLGRTTLSTALETTRLAFDPAANGRFHVSWEALGRTLGAASGPLSDVAGAEVVTHAYVNGVPVTGLELHVGIQSYTVGRGLHQAEQLFIARLVRDALADAGIKATKEDGGGDDVPMLVSRM